MGNGQYTQQGMKYEYQKKWGALNSSHSDEWQWAYKYCMRFNASHIFPLYTYQAKKNMDYGLFKNI